MCQYVIFVTRTILLTTKMFRHQTLYGFVMNISSRDCDIWYSQWHYNDVIMGTITSQITSLTIVYSTVYSDADQRKRQSSASLAFVWGIHRGPVNSPHKCPVTRKMFPFDDVIMRYYDVTMKPNWKGILLERHKSWRYHDMDRFSALLAICQGKTSVTGGFFLLKDQ